MKSHYTSPCPPRQNKANHIFTDQLVKQLFEYKFSTFWNYFNSINIWLIQNEHMWFIKKRFSMKYIIFGVFNIAIIVYFYIHLLISSFFFLNSGRKLSWSEIIQFTVKHMIGDNIVDRFEKRIFCTIQYFIKYRFRF